MRSNIGYLAGIALIWLILAIPAYTALRKAMPDVQTSLAGRGFFVFISGAVIAPGLMSLGHPPPIPVPFMAPIFALKGLISDRAGEDSLFFMSANLFSWLGVTAIIGLIEFVRLIDYELQSKPTSTSLDESAVCRREGEKSQPGRTAAQVEQLEKWNSYLAEFTSRTSERTLRHRAVIEQKQGNLVLSLYEGELDRPFALVQTYETPNWDDLDLYLQLNTSFRKSDFRASN